MANNYRQFALVIGLSAEEQVWWRSMKDALDALPDERDDEEGTAPDALTRLVEDVGYTDDGYVTNVGELINLNSDYVHIASDEYGAVEAIAELISAFLKAHRPTEYVILSWADTCSKMRSGEFGGGECLITGDWVYFPPYNLVSMGDRYTEAKAVGKTLSADEALASANVIAFGKVVTYEDDKP